MGVPLADAVGAAHAHMAHAPARLAADVELDHLVVTLQRVVEQHHRRAGQAPLQGVGHLRATRDVEKPLLARAHCTPTVSSGLPHRSSGARPASR